VNKIQNFEVFITSHGAVLMEGKTKTVILDAILSGYGTLSEISTSQSIPKSTVFSVTNKLIDEGVISYVENGSERRLRCNAARILFSSEVDKEAKKYLEYKDDSWMEQPQSKLVVLHLILSAQSNGVDISPLTVEMGRCIGTTIVNKIGATSIDRGLGEVCRFLSETDLADATVISLFPLKIKVRAREVLSRSSTTVILKMVGGIVSSFMSTSTGVNQSVIDAVHSDDDWNMVTMTFGYPSPGKEKLKSNASRYHSLTPYGAAEDFEIYINDKEFVPVSGKTPLAISKLLLEHSMTSGELSKAVGVPQSTILFNLKNMMSADLVKTKKRNGKNVFISCSRPAIKWLESKEYLYLKAESYLDLAWDDRANASRHILFFILLNATAIGMDLSYAIGNLARIFADWLVESRPNTSMDALMEFMSDKKYNKRIELKVESFFPFTLLRIMDYDMDDEVAKILSNYSISFFGELLLKTTGVIHAVKENVIFGDGNRLQRIVFVPSATAER
jgi:hypothetical protein